MMDSDNHHSNGLYQTSAIARLLVSKPVQDPPTSTSTYRKAESEPPLDLSFTRKRPNIDSRQELAEVQYRKRRADSPLVDNVDNRKRKCVYCPFVASEKEPLYRHYQYHRQLMALPNTSVNLADSSSKDSSDCHVAASQSPGVASPADNSATLRSLLLTSDKDKRQQQSESQTASKYLKSIVQTIIKQRTPIGGSGYSSRVSSRPMTPVQYASRGSSRISSPARDCQPQTNSYQRNSPYNGQSIAQEWSPRGQCVDDRVPQNHQVWSDTPPAGQTWPSGDQSTQQVMTSHVKRESEDSGEETSSTLEYDNETPVRRVYKASSADACVQCELPIAPETSQAADSASGEPGQSRCQHCGITFDDDVIFSIHMGCHNHKDPFICNVCGRACGNKYAFYTHIMRGHEYT